MSAQSYVESSKKSYDDIVHAVRNREGEIKRRNEKIGQLKNRSDKTSWNEMGKRQYLGNEIEELQRGNIKDAAKIKDLKKDLEKAKGRLKEATTIAENPGRFKSKYVALVKDANDRIADAAREIKKIDSKVKALEADHDRAGVLDVGAKRFIRSKQNDLKERRSKLTKSQNEQADRRKGFESKIALVTKVAGSNLAGWGVAALGGLFVAANL